MTEIELLRQQLRASENRQRMILDSAVDYAIIALDLDGRVTQWNQGACRILGWTEADMLGQPASVIFTPEDRQQGAPQSEMHAALNEGRGNDERWHLRKDGSRFWAKGEMMPLRNENGAVDGFVKILRDRTAQRQAAEKNREDAEFLRSVLASSGDCIKVLDLDANLLFMNEGGQKVMEVSDFNAIRGCPWPDFWQGPGKIAAGDAVATARTGRTGYFRGPANTMAGKPRWWDVQVTPILGADGRPEKLLSVSRDVTEAHEATERLELALDAGTVAGTWVWDIPNDRFTGDHRFARAFSLDPDQLAAGLPVGRIVTSIHPDDLARVETLIATALAEGGRYCAEHRVRQTDGSWFWVEASGHCDLDANGRALRFPGALFDIDRRKRHELRQNALLELGETLRTLRGTADITELAHAAAEALGRALDVTRAGYGRVDPDQATITIDRDWRADPAIASVARQHSFTDYGTYIDALIRGETVSIPDVALDSRTRSGFERLQELGIRAMLNVPLMQDGQLVAVMFLHDAGTRVWTDDEIAFARTVADRTWAAKQQALAEAELRRLNETLEVQVAERTAERNVLWNTSPDLLVVIDFEGVFRKVNPAWTALLGYKPAELIDHHVSEFVLPDDNPLTTDAYEFAAAGGQPRVENRYKHKDGSIRWIAWVAVPSGGMIYATGRDVSAKKAADEELASTQQALRQSQKMEAVGQLTGGLAHDFNNLLTGITGSLELLQTRMAQGRLKELDRYVDAAQGAARRAAALTHRLLAFSRRQTLAPKATDVNRLVAGMQELIERTVGPQIAIEPVTAVGLWPTLVDPSQLENALLNLCINARDAMPAGGSLVIETANRWLDERAARERELPPGQFISLCVSDNGSGMPPDVVARAFEPFFTTKPIGQGTGLGLSMIYGFARQSGGQVRIYSEMGQGTMVCLYLPRFVGEGEADAHDVAATLADAPRAVHGETVLVVDDEPTVRMLVTEVLEDLGYTAIEAADGAAGLKVLQSDVRVDLLVTDVGLPGGMNGRQVADAARITRPGLKVLFITGYAENAVLSHGHLDPGMHVLTKPFAMEALASRIKDLIEGR